jgi:uncharacterized protein YndB with AHSA1/START domain
MKRAIVALTLVLILAASVRAQEVRPIVSEGLVEAPLDVVWAAWTTNDGLRAWLAPHVEIELRLGGLMRTNYSAQGKLGDAQTIENTILSFEPKRMLSIKVSKTPDGFPFPSAIQQMWTVLYFEDAGSGRTRVRVVGLGFEPDEESQKMRAFFDQGNAITVKQLQRHFSKVQR